MLKFKKFLLLSLFTFSSTFAAIIIPERNQPCCECEPSSQNFKVFAEYLYWQPLQDNLEYAADLPGGLASIIEFFSTGGLSFSEGIKIHDQKFDWNSGFRLGGAYLNPCSDWDIALYWTHLSQTTSSKAVSANSGIIPITQPLSILFSILSQGAEAHFGSSANSKWRFNYDTLDLLFGTGLSLSNCLSFHPFIGVKGAYIHQKQDVDYFGLTLNTSPVTVANTKKNNFLAIGPSVGIDTSWAFACQWQLSAMLSGSLLYGKFHVSQIPTASVLDHDISINVNSNKKYRIRPNVAGAINLSYSSTLFEKQIALGVGYEIQYYWNQWQSATSAPFAVLNSGAQGDLSLQGLTAFASVQF